jgi:hypothetical protein
MGAVAAVSAVWVTGPDVAATDATSVWPVSAAVGLYVALVAPVIGAQSRPFELQRNHVVLYPLGWGVHDPQPTLSAPPTRAVPEIVGTVVGASAAFDGSTGPTRLAYAVADPTASVALTVSAIVWPKSFATGV